MERKSTAKGINITLEGEQYPCFPTVGANFDFKDVTGKEVNEMSAESVTENITYMWCCARAACRRMHLEFNYDLRQFADQLDNEDVEDWGKKLIAAQTASKKK